MVVTLLVELVEGETLCYDVIVAWARRRAQAVIWASHEAQIKMGLRVHRVVEVRSVGKEDLPEV